MNDVDDDITGTAAEAPPEPTAGSQEEVSESGAARKARKVREGIVTSNKMDRTAVVTVTERVRHPRYNKTLRQDKKLYVHDEANDLNVGDRVRIMETRPLSKTKRWRVVEVLERAR
jgi:small subunit ribosomal protein S17